MDLYVQVSITRTVVSEAYLLAKYLIWQPRLYMGMQIRGIASDSTYHASQYRYPFRHLTNKTTHFKSN